jgi:flagellar basal-body rod protein FlgG
MNPALTAGAAGMAAQQSVLDTIAGNLANIDTPGFRAARPEFAALIAPDGSALGIAAGAPRTLFTQGRLDDTSDPHDLAIDGEGMFRVTSADGRTAYTRAGNFTPDSRGRLVLPNGSALESVRLPRGTTRIEVGDDGEVRADVVGKKAPVSAGRIDLYSFADPAALQLGVDGMFRPSADAGKQFRGTPGSGGFGRVKQRCLERGNVGVVDEMMSMLAAQRAYEANAKTVQAADEMLRLANNLERG